MDINDLLTELVVIADTLDEKGLIDISADIDAATFILSSEEARPLNRTLASSVKSQYITLGDASNEELENEAVIAVEKLMSSMDKILDLEPRLAVAIFKSLAAGANSFLEPVETITDQCIREGAGLLAEAEQKLTNGDFTGVGYRIGVLRSHLEKKHG